MDFIIREMTESDIKECAELIVNTYQQDGVWDYWTVEQTINDLSITFENPKYNEKYFIAELNGEIIGVAGIGESFMSDTALELCYASVKKEYQRKGIGTALTLKRIEYAKKIKKHGYIFVSSRRPEFFDKLGFIRIIDKNKNICSAGGYFCYTEF
jgi:N-acetylglutamate synthase-like GNAT family acetyltransferase